MGKKEVLTPSMQRFAENLASSLAKSLEESSKNLQKNLEESRRNLEESRKSLEESSKKTDITIANIQAKMAESDAKFKKEMKELRKEFNNQWGHLMESLVEGDLVNLLIKRGIEVTGTTSRLRVEVGDKIFELDIVARNGRDIVVTEVKSRLSADDVRRFLEKLAVVKEVFPGYKDKRMYAAVAYLRADDGVVAYAERKGLFVIRTTGDSAHIVNTDSFAPKVF